MKLWHKVTGEKENKDLEKVVLSSWDIIKGYYSSVEIKKCVDDGITKESLLRNRYSLLLKQ